MKLELKHLAPYLPYGLKGISTDDFYGIESVNGFSTYGKKNQINLSTNVDDIDMDAFKPAFRPLSDLTNEIEINDKKFVPYLYWDDESRVNLLSMCATDAEYVEYLEYFIVELLFEWNFDVFGLIPKGLAIDINTLNP